MRKLLPIFLILLLAVPAAAQQAKGRIVGTVTTSDGAVVPGVTVTIESDALIARQMKTQTNDRGQFRFVLLPVGTYTLTMEKDGYASITESGIVVDFNETITVDRSLQGAVSGETITITGEAPIVDETSSSKGDKLDVEFLQNTPSTRNVFNLPNLSAGFTDDSGLGGVQDAGNAFMIDGVNVSDPSTSTTFSQMNLEAVQQVDVNLFGANAEFGSFTGAALNVITKSGGNEFSGEVNYFAQRADWTDDNTDEFQQFGITAPTAADIDDPNFALGGPIVRDKIWFFANYNLQERTRLRSIATGSLDEERTEKRWYGKVSARWDDRNISYASYMDFFRELSHRTVLAPTSLNLESNMWMQESDNAMILLQHSFVATDNLILEGRVGLVDAAFDLVPREFGPTVIDIVTSNFIGVPGVSRQDLNTRDTDSYLATADYYVDDFYGSHSFKIGVEHESNLAGRDFTWKDIIFTGNWTSFGNWNGVAPGDLKLDFGDRVSFARVNRYGFYAQDSWTVSDRLTLNLGVRVDDHSLKSDDLSENRPFGDEEILGFTDAAPRLGFAYDLFGSGKTVLRGFFGRFYEDVVSGDTESLLSQADPTVFSFWNGSQWVPFSISGGTGNVSIDPDLSNQYTQGVMVGVEQQLTEDIAGAITFVYKKDEDIMGQIGPDDTWLDARNISFSNANGSYSGVWYPDYSAGARQINTNPEAGDHGVLDDLVRNYYGLIFEVNKRMSDNYSVKASYTWSRNSGTAGQAGGTIQGFTNYSNPNAWINADGRTGLEREHVVKVSGTYIAPFEIFISPFVRWQTGVPKQDTLFIRDLDGSGGRVVAIEPLGGVDGDHRFESQLNIDLRVEKAFIIQDRYRLGLIFDVFNALNDDSVTARRTGSITSSSYDVPSTIVNPRTYQAGVRLIF